MSGVSSRTQARRLQGRVQHAKLGGRIVTAPRTLEPTRRPVVRILLGAGQKWVARCVTCGDDVVYAGSAKTDTELHARWHRDAHRIAARAER